MTDVTGNTVDTDETGTPAVGNEQTPAPAKNTAQSRIQELVEEKNALKAELDAEKVAKETAKFEIETQYARELYGETVEDPAVQEFKRNNPTLTYKQVFGAMGIEVPTVSGGVGTPGRAVGSLSSVGREEAYSMAELTAMRGSDPQRYNEVTTRIAAGEIKVK